MKAAQRFTVGEGEAGRVDRFLARRFPGASRRRLAALFEAGEVEVGGARARKGDFVALGSEVVVAAAPLGNRELHPVAQAGVALELLYSDELVIAMAKPAGMASHPLRAGELDTLANALVAAYPECRGIGDDPREAGLAHRLDAGTSGVLIAARDDGTWRALRASFASGAVGKEYLALVAGHPGAGGCAAELAQRGRRAVVAPGRGQRAATSWEVDRVLGPYTLLRCRTSTGRMHQVRVHLAHVGLPLVGDGLYGGPAACGLVGHFLHAARVEMPHPRGAGALVVCAPLPVARQRFLASLDSVAAGQVDLDEEEE